MNEFEKIDKVLSYLNSKITESVLPSHLPMQINIDSNEGLEILRKLVKDGYATEETFNKEIHFYSTFDGRLFEKQGGYIQINKNIIAETNLKNRLNKITSYAAGLAGLYVIFEFLLWIYRHWYNILTFLGINL